MTIDIKELQRRSRLAQPATETYDSAVRAGKKSAFLCHSHADRELVKGLVQWFHQVGVSLYVDWADHEMPPTPNAETADKLKKRIASSHVFLFLATQNSMTSRWCPWEIGVADGKKGADWIVIIPTKDATGVKGSEYLQLYRRLDEAVGGELSVIRPGNVTGTRAAQAL